MLEEVVESTGVLRVARASDCGCVEAVDDVFERATGGMALMSGISSFGRDRASATTLASPFRYRISVVYSDMQANWYVWRMVCGSVFLVIEGTRLAWSV